MAVLGLMKRGRKAKEAAQTQTEKHNEQNEQNEQPPRTKYRHVPTHAATDALLGAPSGWNREDASKIREHNRRRSALHLAAQGNQAGSRQSVLSPLHGNMAHNYSTGSLDGAGAGSSNGASSPSSASSRGPGHWSRSNSGLSKVSFPAGPANPVVHMSQSYKSMDAALHKDALLTPTPASYDWRSRTQTVPSSGPPVASAPLSPGGQGSKGASSSSSTSTSTSFSSYLSYATNTSNSSNTSLSEQLRDSATLPDAREKGKGRLQG